jgi:hypothetical protein
VKPLLPPEEDAISGAHGAVFHADFRMNDEKTLEKIIFADDQGQLVYVEVDCCANSIPVPEEIAVEEPPYHIWATTSLFREA